MNRRARNRELVVQTRLQARFERRIEREVLAELKMLSRVLRDEYTVGGSESMISLVGVLQRQLYVVFRKRLLAVARTFGVRLFERTEKSTGPTELKGALEIFEGHVLRWVENHSTLRSVLIADTVRSKVREVLADSSQQGERVTARRLQREIGGGRTRAEAARIARTESHTAATVGAHIAAESSPVLFVKEWGATEDGRTRPNHSNADAQLREMDDPFDVGGSKLMFPGDPNGPAREVINCRCVALYNPKVVGEILR